MVIILNELDPPARVGAFVVVEFKNSTNEVVLSADVVVTGTLIVVSPPVTVAEVVQKGAGLVIVLKPIVAVELSTIRRLEEWCKCRRGCGIVNCHRRHCCMVILWDSLY